MCENAKNCYIVAVLIATVAFTSAYQIPGGYNNGHPILKNKPAFILFTFTDAISLSSALTSVIVFLNIVTSPFWFKDFASSLYQRQLLGLILLIISVAMMMVAFAATLFITISTESKWTTELTLYLVSVFPVAVFVYSYVDEYMKLLKDAYKVLKKIMKEAVEYVQETWEYKPPSLHSNAGSSVHVAIHSPV
ncbi:ankyrin repeat-containing protein ITN1-like [Rutidosis leptorrhynchoides]|uniref:ankyrin repeat-containing protein ITN1-like n=1 Tax=Rutidosis leptorrhynchoides TaxID=125765 RepID=UPI003A99CE30